MNSATLRTVEAHATAVAILAGEHTEARRRATQLLTRHAFRIADEAMAAVPGPSTVLVHFGAGTETERLQALRAWTERRPDGPTIAVLPSDSTNASMRRVLLAGAVGIVLDGDMGAALVPTARAVLSGQLVVPRALGRQIAPRPLSHREKQILVLVMRGRTNREIAQELFLAESTVKTHLSSAFRKIDARSRSEAVAKIRDPETGYGAHILDLDVDAATPSA